MWTFQEYVNTTGSPYTYGSWAVRAIQLKAPLPAMPSACSPAAICQGATNVSVTVTGTSTGGTAFFDPGPDTGGPGFTNHISALVSGTGVTVNSVAFTDVTHVTLNLSVDPLTSTPGTYDITVTNPDGQTATGTGILTVNAAPAQPSAISGPATVCQGQSGVSYSVTSVSGMTYSWSYSGTGATLTPSGNSVSVDFGASAGSGTLSVTATNGSGCGSTASTLAITVNALPSAPAAPSFSSVTQNSLTVNWSAVSGATSYDVWRATGASCSGATKVTGSPVSSPSYPDSGLTCNTPYSYFIVANNGCGASANGSCATQTTAACCLSPTFVSADANAPTANVPAGQILIVSNPAGSAVPGAFAFTWDNAFTLNAFTSDPDGILGFWQVMVPYGTPFVPTATYQIIRRDASNAFVDINGDGIYQSGSDYDVSLSGKTITVTRPGASGTESQNTGYRLILQDSLFINPDVGTYPVQAALSASCGSWSASLFEIMDASPAGCAPTTPVGTTLMVTKSASQVTLDWAAPPADGCMTGYAVFASTDPTAWSHFAPITGQDLDMNTANTQFVAGLGLNVTYYLVAEVGGGGQLGPLGHYGM